MDREKIVRIIDELIFEAQKEPNWKAESALKCLKKELLKEQDAKPVEVCGQMFTIKYGHCPKCGKGMDSEAYPHWCGFCGQAVNWE